MHGVESIVEVALSKSPASSVVNVVHSRLTLFSDIVSAINDELVNEGISTSKLSVITFQKWFSLLVARAADGNADELKDLPAIKLIDFFRNMGNEDLALGLRKGNGSGGGDMPEFSTTKASRVSKTMEDLPPIGESDVQMWVKYWKGAGLFSEGWFFLRCPMNLHGG